LLYSQFCRERLLDGVEMTVVLGLDLCRGAARALSYESPIVPIEAFRPASTRRSVYRIEVYWLGSTGRCNTGLLDQQ